MKKINIYLVLIFFLAFLIRLIAINQSLWLDEGTTAKVVQSFGFTQIISGFSPHDFHPPLYYLFMKLWTNFFGYSEIALRMPSVIFSLLTGYVIYKMAKWLNGSIIALWGTIFFLFNPLIIYYSQEVRMYMMVTFLLVCGLYFLIKMLQSQNSNVKCQNLFVGLFFSLSLLTFYGSVFFIATFLIYLFYKKEYKLLLITCCWLLGIILILSPLLYQQLMNAKVSLQIVTNWSLVLGKANLKNLLLIPIKFTSGRISWEPKWLYYIVSGGWLIFILYQILNIPTSPKGFDGRGKYQNDKSKIKYLKLFTLLLLLPLLIGFIVSFFTPLLQYFRFLYLIPVMSILLAIGANKNWQRYVLASGFIFFSLVYLFNPQFHREDWKSLAKNISANSVVYAIPSSMDALKYYSSKLTIKELANLRVNELKKQKSIFVIPYTSEIYGIDYKKDLEKNNYSLKKTKNFRGLTLQSWQVNLHK